MGEVAANRSRASAKQVEFYKALHANAGVTMSGSRLKAFKALSVGHASLEIQRIQREVKSFALDSYVPARGLATSPQLRYFMKLRQRLGEPAAPEEIEALKQRSTAEMQKLNSEVMQRLQDKRDALGVPLPAWRLERGPMSKRKQIYPGEFV